MAAAARAAFAVLLLAFITAGRQEDGLRAAQEYGLGSRSILAAAAQNGFGVASEIGRSLPGSASELVTVPSFPTQLPATELEAEVQRTSRVAAFLAQDAAVLSKELLSLQNSLRGAQAAGRLEPEVAQGLLQSPEAQAFSAISLSAEPAPAAAPAPAPAASQAFPAAVTDASKAAASPAPGAGNSTSGEVSCGGAGQTPCSDFNKVLTFEYRYPVMWGILNWGLIVVLSVLTFWCCCSCAFRRR
eukprot:TRINITY_DN8662_c0_g1_i1.p1 TRINITY_DN8662_c0_g1~~TRINITY_DN8662_c0_g1_i1.p1  ORF type:complete len:244 (-),score=72.43 TRINITY_DN8662_c0_g1_i1:42-773(-)